MNPKHYIAILVALFLLLLASCSKNTANNNGTEINREQPAHPEGISITLDTTWLNDTIIPF